MNLTDLQVKLRSIEGHISQLHTEIERMKPQIDEQKKTDFDVITKLAKQHSINGIGINKVSEVLKNEFVNRLSYLLLSEETPVNMLTVIADMAKIMGCDKEKIRVLAQIAKSRLLGDLDIHKNIPLPSKFVGMGN